jgi:hypothetical protein
VERTPDNAKTEQHKNGSLRAVGATQTLVNWNKIAARLVEVNGRYGISGALLQFGADGAVRMVDALSRLADETRDTAELAPSDRDALLGAAGPKLTNMWLLDRLGKAMSGSAPDMRLLRAGIEQSVIALWLGYEQVGTTDIYLHADMEIKERALARTTPAAAAAGRFKPGDQLINFLAAL